MSSPTESEIRAARMAHRSFSLPFVDNILSNRRRKSSQSINETHLQQPFVAVHPSSIHSGINYEEWSDDKEDVEADVLYPQYEGEMQDKADMAAFDEMVDRRTSNSTLKLSRTLSKRSRSYGDQHAMVKKKVLMFLLPS